MASSSQSPSVPASVPVFGLWRPDYEDDASSLEEEDSFLDFFLPVRAGQPALLKLPSQVPNFLINSLDGAFTPYTDRSPACSPTEEEEDPFRSHGSAHSPPCIPSTSIRSPTSILVYEKMLFEQAQMLGDVGHHWNSRYPPRSAVNPTPAASEEQPHQLRRNPSIHSACTHSASCCDLSSRATPSERSSLDVGMGLLPDGQSAKVEAHQHEAKRQEITAWVGRLSLAEKEHEASHLIKWEAPNTL